MVVVVMSIVVIMDFKEKSNSGHTEHLRSSLRFFHLELTATKKRPSVSGGYYVRAAAIFRSVGTSRAAAIFRAVAIFKAVTMFSTLSILGPLPT